MSSLGIPDYSMAYTRGSGIQMTRNIYEFNGLCRFLSNFFEWPIVVDGHEYATVEHYYQASKADNEEEFYKIKNATTPGLAKRMGQTCLLRSDWCDELRLEIMEIGLRAKFSAQSVMRYKLDETKPVLLAEGNNWGDKFWGQIKINGKWVGENHLGLLLMKIRDE